MAWKISKVEVSNFKFFKDLFEIDIDCKNILLYGENGAGKSSLYWSLYTHYQAYAKTREQAVKYFIHGHNENLRSRYSDAGDASYIKVAFDNGNGQIRIIEDSHSHCYTDDEDSKKFMRHSMMASDFMNYKFLSSLFDFCNSEENEVFKYFVKEVLPFIDLDQPLSNIEGVVVNTNNSGDWWSYIENAHALLPKNQKNYNSFNQKAPQYKEYIRIIDRFNDLFKDALLLIEKQANALLKNTFKMDARIRIDYEGVKFNERVGKKARDLRLHSPKVYLRAFMDAPNVVDSSIIRHPKSFFNEAKITCMALAIRLAVLERRPSLSQAASTLFIDDLLISLDMGLRRQVIKMILDYSNRYQLFIFTHDRAFFHMIWSEIEARKQLNEWKKYELYAQARSGYPTPYLVESKSHLQEAKLLYEACNIPACANALRRACEQQMKRLLPHNMLYKISQEDTGVVLHELNGLIQNYKAFIGKFQFPDVAPSLHNSRRLILNPFSHDDINTPFYRNELEELMIELEKLSEVSRRTLNLDEDLHSKRFTLKITNAEFSRHATFVFAEYYHELSYKGNKYYGNPRVKVLESDVKKVETGKEYSLRTLYTFLYNAVSLNAETAPPLPPLIYDTLTNKPILEGN